MEEAGTLLAASWIRSRSHLKLRSLTRSDKMETKVRHRREDAITMEREALMQTLLDAHDDVVARAELEQQLADAIQSVTTLPAQAPVDSETLRRQAEPTVILWWRLPHRLAQEKNCFKVDEVDSYIGHKHQAHTHKKHTRATTHNITTLSCFVTLFRLKKCDITTTCFFCLLDLSMYVSMFVRFVVLSCHVTSHPAATHRGRRIC